jgi:hypothetical protein
MNFLLDILNYAYNSALKQMQLNLLGRLLSLHVSYDSAAFYRVADALATAGNSLEPLSNIISGVALLSFMALVVSVATLNSRREWFHNLMTLAAFLMESFGLFLSSYYYNIQLDAAIANAKRNVITAIDWAAYLKFAPEYERVYQQVYGFWGAPYSFILAISGWVIAFALGIAVFTVPNWGNWSGPPTCKVCMRNYTLIDKKEQKWYCATDDRLYLAKQDQVIENASKQGLLATEVKAKAEETRQVITKTPPPMMFCRECGANILRSSKFCGECGKRLS